MVEVTDIKGIGPAKAETLAENGYESVEEISTADPDELADVDGVGDERALDFIVGAENVIEESEDDSDEGEEFDLTPAEVSDEVEEVEEEEEEVEEEEEEVEEEEEDEEPVYSVSLYFDSREQYDVFHAAIMRYSENVYTSNQPSANAMEKCLDGLYGNETSVRYELTEYELNTLHTAVKQQRTSYQGDNLIDQMDALRPVEEQIDDIRRAELF